MWRHLIRWSLHNRVAVLVLAVALLVWGGLVAPAPETVPQVTHALWDRVFAAATEQVGPKMYRVGDVTVDANLRVVAFPAKINQIVG